MQPRQVQDRTMRAESIFPKAYVQRPNQQARNWWKTESCQPLSVYECPAFEVLGCGVDRVFITASRRRSDGGGGGGVERPSVLLMRLREVKDRAEMSF